MMMMMTVRSKSKWLMISNARADLVGWLEANHGARNEQTLRGAREKK